MFASIIKDSFFMEATKILLLLEGGVPVGGGGRFILTYRYYLLIIASNTNAPSPKSTLGNVASPLKRANTEEPEPLIDA